MAMRKLDDGGPRSRGAEKLLETRKRAIRERGQANLQREAMRQAGTTERLRNPMQTTFGDIETGARDKEMRENYGPGTRKYMGPMLRDAEERLRRKR